MLLYPIPTLSLLMGTSWILCAFVEDITDELPLLDAIRRRSTGSRRKKAIECIRKIVRDYLTTKELSSLI